MSATLKRTSSPIASARTLVLTAQDRVQTIVIGGFVANKDATEAYHGVTFEVQKPDSTITTLVKNAVVAVGGSLVIPKIVMESGDKMYLTADADNVLEAYVSYVEKS